MKRPNGQKSEIQISDSATLGDLLCMLSVTINDIQTGYPPRPLYGSSSDSLQSLGIMANTVINVLSNRAASQNVQRSYPQLAIRIMDDDNSCLFSALGYLLENHSRDAASLLRQIVASIIVQDPEYTEAVLGRSKEAYALWIQQPSSWGGAIEMSVLSECYRVEIASVDAQTTRIDIFGETKGYAERVYVLYSGIHYDAIVETPELGAPESFDITRFPSNDYLAQSSVLDLAVQAQKEHRYTDLASFTLVCENCGARIKGEAEAQMHAAKTGHSNFCEYK